MHAVDDPLTLFTSNLRFVKNSRPLAAPALARSTGGKDNDRH